jgi:hypothetical protein
VEVQREVFYNQYSWLTRGLAHSSGAGSNRKLIIPANRAPRQVATMTQQVLEHNAMKRAHHATSGAPLDFYLFGCVKQLLAGIEK